VLVELEVVRETDVKEVVRVVDVVVDAVAELLEAFEVVGELELEPAELVELPGDVEEVA
jgi:hypothetical protein